jgi:iron-sulfur cluster assembly protein
MSRPLTATVKAATKKRIFSPRAAIVLTRAATEKIRSLLELHPDAIALRVGVRTRGCNGLSYMLDYATEKGKFDEEVNQNGARVLIDSKAQLTLLGTEMDYVSTKLSSEFVFNNPNVKGTCGCGESFTV